MFFLAALNGSFTKIVSIPSELCVCKRSDELYDIVAFPMGFRYWRVKGEEGASNISDHSSPSLLSSFGPLVNLRLLKSRWVPFAPLFITVCWLGGGFFPEWELCSRVEERYRREEREKDRMSTVKTRTNS